MSPRRMLFVLVVVSTLSVSTASAQSLGTFRWQLQPFCNVFTLNVTQQVTPQATIYLLDGTDDRCGGGNQAGTAVGIAHLTPLGLVGFGITTVLPGGTPVHTEATITVASLNGTWRDSAGNTGTFIFTPGPAVPGAPRTVSATGLAPGSVTNVLIAPNAVTTANIAPNAVTTNSIADSSITYADLAAPPRIASATANAVSLTAVDSTVTSITIAAPAAGNILANVSATYVGNPEGTTRRFNCALTTGTTLPGADSEKMFVDYQELQNVVAGSNRFTVAAAGNVTINFVCREFVGDTTMYGIKLTGLYVGQ